MHRGHTHLIPKWLAVLGIVHQTNCATSILLYTVPYLLHLHSLTTWELINNFLIRILCWQADRLLTVQSFPINIHQELSSQKSSLCFSESTQELSTRGGWWCVEPSSMSHMRVRHRYFIDRKPSAWRFSNPPTIWIRGPLWNMICCFRTAPWSTWFITLVCTNQKNEIMEFVWLHHLHSRGDSAADKMIRAQDDVLAKGFINKAQRTMLTAWRDVPGPCRKRRLLPKISSSLYAVILQNSWLT